MYTLNNLENKEEFRLFSPKLFILKNFKPTEYIYAGPVSNAKPHNLLSFSKRWKEKMTSYIIHIAYKEKTYQLLKGSQVFLTCGWDRKFSCIHLKKNTVWDHTQQPNSNWKLCGLEAFSVSRGCMVWRYSVGVKSTDSRV